MIERLKTLIHPRRGDLLVIHSAQRLTEQMARNCERAVEAQLGIIGLSGRVGVLILDAGLSITLTDNRDITALLTAAEWLVDLWHGDPENERDTTRALAQLEFAAVGIRAAMNADDREEKED